MQVKSLLVKIGTDTKQMERGLTSARGKMKAFTGQVQKMGRGMAIAGAAITGAIGLMVKGFVQAGDEVHKMSLRTGVSTEALGELKYAAELGGTSIGVIEKAIKKMASTLGEAKKGTKTYTDALALIGLEVKDLDSLNPEEQFIKMAEGLADLAEKGYDPAYAAQMLFGRAGTELLPMLSDGAEGLKKVREEAHKMSYIFDKEAAAKAAELQDRMTDLKGSLQAVTLEIAEQLVPVIITAVEKMTEAIQKVKNWTQENPALTKTLAAVALGLGGLLAVLGPIALVLPSIVIGVKQLGKAFLFLAKNPMVLLAAGLSALALKFYMLRIEQEALTKETKLEIGTLEERTLLYSKVAKAAGITLKRAVDLRNEYGLDYVALFEAIKLGEEGVDLQEAYAKVLAQVKTKLEGARIAMLQFIPPEFMVTLEDVRNRLQEWREELDPLGLSTLEVAEDCNELDLAWKQFAISSEDNFAKVMEGMGFFVRDTEEKAGQYKEILKTMTEAQQRFTTIAIGEFVNMEASFKGMVNAILNTLEQWAIGEIIVAVLKSPIPFPLNLLAIGGAVLAIKTLFAGIRSMETGGFVPKETIAHLHPGEYVVPAPDVKALTAPGGTAGASPFPNRLYNDITIILGGERFKHSVVEAVNEASDLRELRIKSHSVVD